jgi:hypothetical protein
MKSVHTVILITGIICFACNNNKKDTPADSNKTIARLPGIDSLAHRHVNPDTLYTLLASAATLDTFEFDSWEPFLFLKTGNLFSDSAKHAVLITCLTDSIYKLELYSLKNNKWNKMDELDSLEAFPIQFDTKFADYNFDGLKDIYIQYSVSNGYALSYGHLLTLDPKTMQLARHPEASNLGSINPDPETKTVSSEQVIECRNSRETAICTLRSKWETGKLKVIKKDCPCEQQKN